MVNIPENLKQIAEQVKDGNSHTETVRTLISWFGAQRRGYWVVKDIRRALKQANLITVPSFESAYIDSLIEFRHIPPETEQVVAFKPEVPTLDGGMVEVVEAVPRMVVGGSVPDPVPRIGLLEAANNPPVSVKRDGEVSEAVTLMLMHDYSQLPVMQNERTVAGIISWKSIGIARTLNRDCQYVRQCMETDAYIINYDTPLFASVGIIAQKEVVLVRNAENKIVGLVTTSDISLQFGSLSEPFLLLGEIENHIRRLIDGKYSVDALTAAKDPSDAGREIENVADLTIGEYIRLLENPDNWNQLGYGLCRRSFVKQLGEVRRIRNEVMHFHPDGISDGDLNLLRDTVKFMQEL